MILFISVIKIHNKIYKIHIFKKIYIYDSDFVRRMQLTIKGCKIRVVCVGNFLPFMLINCLRHTKSDIFKISLKPVVVEYKITL